jgi:hypothetical protein
MLNGWQVPIAILATQGIFAYVVPALARWFAPDRTPTRRLAITTVAAIIAFSALTNVYLFGWRFFDLSRYDYPYFLYQDEIAALRWLEENAGGDAVVLSSLAVGQYIPAETGAHAFLAHWAQTVDYYGKEAAVARFFASDAPEPVRAQIITDFGVDYIFHGPAERTVGSVELDDNPNYDRVFASGDVAIYAPVVK